MSPNVRYFRLISVEISLFANVVTDGNSRSVKVVNDLRSPEGTSSKLGSDNVCMDVQLLNAEALMDNLFA